MADVTFKITGDPKQALKALDDVISRLNTIGTHPGIKNLQRSFSQATRDIRAVNRQLAQFSSTLNHIRRNQQGVANQVSGMVRIYNRVNNSTNTYNRNIQQAARNTRQLHSTVQRLASAMHAVGRGTGIFLQSATRSVASAAQGVRGAVGSGVGGIQSAGISTRMGGIAAGNVLAQIGAGNLSGNIASGLIQGIRNALRVGTGLVSIGAEIATRIVTGLAGTLTKMVGPVVGGVFKSVVGTLGWTLALGGQGLTRGLGMALNGIADTVQNLMSGLTQFAGEMVVQLGNVFTGLSEIVRGAVQAAVNVATGLLNGLLNIATSVIEKVAGIGGKVAGAVGAATATVGGAALKRRVEGDTAGRRATILFDRNVTNEQKANFREALQQMAQEFPTLAAGEIGKAAEMLVSTGFQGDPEGALSFLRGILPLGEVAGLQNLGELARSTAKMFGLAREEVTQKAAAAGISPGEFVAGRIFQARNVGDVEIKDLALRGGEAIGVGSAFGLSLDETLETISRLSRGLSPEETFTAFRSLVTRLQKPQDDTIKMFDALGISLKDLTEKQKEEIRVLEARKAALDPKGKGYKAATKELDQQIGAIQMRAETRNVLDIIGEAVGMRAAGKISGEQFATLFPNVRGLKGVAAEAALGPDVKAQVREEFARSPAGVTTAAMAETREGLGFKFADVWRAMQAPFDKFWAAMEGRLGGFLDKMTEGFRRLAGWSEGIFADEGFGKFLDRIGQGIMGAGGDGFLGAMESLLAMDPASFWESMNRGMDWIVEKGGQVVEFFKTVIKLLGDLSKAIGVGAEAWGTLGQFFSGIGEGIGKMAEGDTSPVLNLIDQIKEGLNSLFESVLAMLTKILSAVQPIVQQVMGIVGGVGEGILPGMTQAIGGAAAFFGTGALARPQAGGPAGALPLLAAGVPGATSSSRIGQLRGVVGQARASGRTPHAQLRSNRLRGAAGAGGRGLMRGAAPFAGAMLATDLIGLGSGQGPGAGLGDYAGNAMSGALVGGAIGSAVPVIGTAIGAITGAILAALGTFLADLVGSGKREADAAAAKALQKKTEYLQMVEAATSAGMLVTNERGFSEPTAAPAGPEGQIALMRQRQGAYAQMGDPVSRMQADLIGEQIRVAQQQLEAQRMQQATLERISGSLEDDLARAQSLAGMAESLPGGGGDRLSQIEAWAAELAGMATTGQIDPRRHDFITSEMAKMGREIAAALDTAKMEADREEYRQYWEAELAAAERQARLTEETNNLLQGRDAQAVANSLPGATIIDPVTGQPVSSQNMNVPGPVMQPVMEKPEGLVPQVDSEGGAADFYSANPHLAEQAAKQKAEAKKQAERVKAKSLDDYLRAERDPYSLGARTTGTGVAGFGFMRDIRTSGRSGTLKERNAARRAKQSPFSAFTAPHADAQQRRMMGGEIAGASAENVGAAGIKAAQEGNIEAAKEAARVLKEMEGKEKERGKTGQQITELLKGVNAAIAENNTTLVAAVEEGNATLAATVQQMQSEIAELRAANEEMKAQLADSANATR